MIPIFINGDPFMKILGLTAETLGVSAFGIGVSTRSLSPTAGRGLRLYPEALSWLTSGPQSRRVYQFMKSHS